MLKQRIVTALTLLPLVLGAFFLIQLEYFAGVVLVITYLVALEWAKVAGMSSSLGQSFYAIGVSIVNLVIWWFGGDLELWPSPNWPFELVFHLPMVALLVSIVAIILAVTVVACYTESKVWWKFSGLLLFIGLALLPAFFVALVSTRAVGYLIDVYLGGQFLLLMFCIIWAADTGAFITGKLFGKNKLAPLVSPNKTWEGAAGGFILSVAIAWLGVVLIGFEVASPLWYTLAAVGLAVLSVYGDLFESALKRAANIKDSGNLLPGHGGLFDRLDSSLVVAPLFYLIFSYMGWFR
ncbi:phosphatidate cytidylyltransferase [Aliikangiella sp. IMCC44653]